MKNTLKAFAVALTLAFPSIPSFAVPAPPAVTFVVANDTQPQQVLCSALGHVGASVAEAIQNCRNSGTIQPTCAQNVSCPASAMCTANGYAGDSVDAAVRECSADSHVANYTCAQNVSCAGGSTVYRAMGFAGSSVQSAIQMCIWSYTRVSCARNVTPENAPLCKASGYAGASVQEAIQECRSNGGQDCDKNVSCAGLAQQP